VLFNLGIFDYMCYAVFMSGDAQRKPTYKELEARVEFVEKENAELRAIVVKLMARIEELEKKLAEKQPRFVIYSFHKVKCLRKVKTMGFNYLSL